MVNLSRLIFKLRISACFLCDLLRTSWRKFYKVNNYSAQYYLSSLHEDVNTSCIHHNNIAKELVYDLQIIIPVYKVEEYLETCLESVFGQNSGYRVLVVAINDGSPDKCPTILERYSNLDDFMVINQDNRGFSGARNRGLENIRARYIMFLDSDDYLANGAVKGLLDVAYSTNAEIVQGGYECFQDDKTLNRVLMKKEHNRNSLYGYPWGKIYSSHLFSNLHFPEKYWFEDTFIHLLINHVNTKIQYWPGLAYRYRNNLNGITNTYAGKIKVLDSFYITKRIIKDAKKLNFDLESLHKPLLLQFKMNYYRIATLCSHKINYAVFSETCDLYISTFDRQYDGKNSKLSRLSKALINKNYRQYLIAMI